MTVAIGELIDSALVAYDELGLVGETVVDDWQYVTDLRTVWRARLVGVRDARGSETQSAVTVGAVERAVEEIGRIDDPHRAIDWLSTFPQILLLALGEAE
ncbi:MAG TPA: hypothetical protein VIM30_17345 [Candidatus Limnocylindrales bacterium]